MVKVVQRTEPEADLAGPDDSHQVESLDNIAALGTSLEVKPVAPGQVAAEKAEDAAAAEEIAVALELLRAALLPFAPAHTQDPLALIWSNQQLERIAQAIVDLCKFHGWTVGDFFTEYGPYLQLLAALGMPLLATLKILKMPPPQQAAANGQQQ